MSGGYETDEVVKLETNLDDLSPEVAGAVMDALFAAGALDVWFTPIHMKKNRPGFMLSALCEEDQAAAVIDVIFSETTAFGLRRDRITRIKLGRRFEKVATRFGEITIKLGLKGEQIVQASPEFASCREAAERNGVPLREVYDAAIAAWRATT